MKPDSIKRLRMFAGPNGSGKSTLVRWLAREYSPNGYFHLQRYVNADDILRDLQNGPGFSFAQFGLTVSIEQIFESLIAGQRIPDSHPFLTVAEVTNSVLRAPATACDSYIAAAVADYLRETFLNEGKSFSFETVMSHVSKVQFFANARAAGFRTYLYFVATESPFVNQHRIETRVEEGGHDVPPDKVRERYDRSLHLAAEAAKHASRAYFFDNSGSEPLHLAELTPDGKLELKTPTDSLPAWFKTHVAKHFIR